MSLFKKVKHGYEEYQRKTRQAQAFREAKQLQRLKFQRERLEARALRGRLAMKERAKVLKAQKTIGKAYGQKGFGKQVMTALFVPQKSKVNNLVFGAPKVLRKRTKHKRYAKPYPMPQRRVMPPRKAKPKSVMQEYAQVTDFSKIV